MAATFTIRGRYNENVPVTSRFRVTSDGIVLPPGGADTLEIAIFERSARKWHRAAHQMPTEALHNPKTGPEWPKSGAYNFTYSVDVVSIGAGLPDNFVMRAGHVYTIRYTIVLPVSEGQSYLPLGDIVLEHIATIE